jgi:hypothetical protein
MNQNMVRILAAAGLIAVSGLTTAASAASAAGADRARVTEVVPVLQAAMVHFDPDSQAKDTAPGLAHEDHGRIVRTRFALPADPPPGRIHARFTLHPVARTDREVWDRWDRAGNLRLVVDGRPDLEIARFMTSYGGRTDHVVDVSELAPLLRGERTVRAFVDTWVSPAWRIDFALSYEPDTLYTPPVWAEPIFYTDSFNAEEHGDGTAVTVTVPPGLVRVVLRYFSTGHCTDGRGADEFVAKANVIAVDGVVVHRYHPWRDDCRRFRDRNPYCARWTDGTWSSDYSRSGWCPGDEVLPLELDLSDHLTAGEHTVRFVIEDMRPRDADGHLGYWRVSAALVGWDRPPRLWRN